MHNSNSRLFRSSLALLFSHLLFVCAFGVRAGQALELGDTAPDWILSNSRGEHVSFYQDSADRRAVLLFWATWCPFCAELMPELEKLRAQIESDGVRFYALNIWEDSDPLQHMQNNGFDFTLLLDADQVAKRYNVRSTPGVFVVNADKSIEYIRTKGSSMAEVYRAVEAALSGER
ncbi:MAG: TlpA disulfide reductase family protein [Cellvibrionaceae bacterium]